MDVILLTFDSVNFTMMTEKKLIEMGYKIKTIPTPREISRSCGLAIMVENKEIDNIVKLKNDLPIGYIWKYKKEKGNVEVVKIA
ncbi:DUF3343 domain-containing protein [Miniphocaeibacter halophilus]|uniref:DUF3343 domain-containing protein n=1 Tax=Miniphocaeibacter halophilus TaxID=2931922 RepID=A0AC61MS63_9FIRM|nr:DUF3343 domain-containing protein [Miniphocaeibacter halophilus]QQK08437.1 DUF3343 domain-containing protein [Miniphocaeibacter halophilus]